MEEKGQVCDHPYVARAWIWDSCYHCYDCGMIVEEDES